MRFFRWFCFDMTRVIKIVLFTIRLQEDQQPSYNINYADTLSSSLAFFLCVRFKSLLRAYADKMLEKTIFVTFFIGFVEHFCYIIFIFPLSSLTLTHAHTFYQLEREVEQGEGDREIGI